jgi:hypothetical protein
MYVCSYVFDHLSSNLTKEHSSDVRELEKTSGSKLVASLIHDQKIINDYDYDSSIVLVIHILCVNEK